MPRSSAASRYQRERQLRQKPASSIRSMFCTSVRSRRCFTSRRKAAASSSVRAAWSIGSNRSAWPLWHDEVMDEQNRGVPEDPSGIEEPHDVLAAEEFAMPAGEDALGGPGEANPRSWTPLLVIAVAWLVLLWWRRRR